MYEEDSKKLLVTIRGLEEEEKRLQHLNRITMHLVHLGRKQLKLINNDQIEILKMLRAANRKKRRAQDIMQVMLGKQ